MASSGVVDGLLSTAPSVLLGPFDDDSGGPRLQSDDVIAGGLLFLIGVFGLSLYGVVCTTMARMCEIVGFRFILSQALCDIFLLLQFAIWPGLVILTKSEITPPEFRWHLHIYLDATWWAMVYHYPILAWSRLAAVQHPNWFRLLSPTKCFLICSAAWVIGVVQSLVEHQFSWFEPLHYDPTTYGLTADWAVYGKGGTYSYFLFFNVSMMVIPFPFYGYAIFLLFNRHRKQPLLELSKGRTSLTPSLVIVQRQLSIESRLLLPCVINTLIFVFGQVLITLCSKYQGKWIGWLVMVLFTMNSLVNPILYLTFSTVIRRHVFTSCRKRLSSSAIYREYDNRSVKVKQPGKRLPATSTTVLDAEATTLESSEEEQRCDDVRAGFLLLDLQNEQNGKKL